MAMPLKIEHRAGIRAPASAIWAQLVDIESWPSWNPLYTEAKGVVRIGAELDLTVSLQGQAPRRIRPVIVDWVPNEQLHWRLSMMAGLVKTIRYLEIEELGPGSCIFSNGEIFEGMLGPTIAARLRGPLRAGFQAMGEAVKARAEAAAAS
jgi:hypothetical protein